MQRLFFILLILVGIPVLTVIYQLSPRFFQARNVPASQNSGRVRVLISESTVEWSQPLWRSNFREEYWPKGSAPVDAVQSLPLFKFAYARVKIMKGVPLQEAHITLNKRSLHRPINSSFRLITLVLNEKELTALRTWGDLGSLADVVLLPQKGGRNAESILISGAQISSFGCGCPIHQKRLKGKYPVYIELTKQQADQAVAARGRGELLGLRQPSWASERLYELRELIQ